MGCVSYFVTLKKILAYFLLLEHKIQENRDHVCVISS